MKEEKGHTFWHKSIKTEEHSQSSWAPKHKVWFQKNDDTKLGDLDNKTIHKMMKERGDKLDTEYKWKHKDKRWKAMLNELGRRHGVNK